MPNLARPISRNLLAPVTVVPQDTEWHGRALTAMHAARCVRCTAVHCIMHFLLECLGMRYAFVHVCTYVEHWTQFCNSTRCSVQQATTRNMQQLAATSNMQHHGTTCNIMQQVRSHDAFEPVSSVRWNGHSSTDHSASYTREDGVLCCMDLRSPKEATIQICAPTPGGSQCCMLYVV